MIVLFVWTILEEDEDEKDETKEEQAEKKEKNDGEPAEKKQKRIEVVDITQEAGKMEKRMEARLHYMKEDEKMLAKRGREARITVLYHITMILRNGW